MRYLLARDHLPVGQLEQLLDCVLAADAEPIHANGWLARYVHDAAQQLRARSPA